MHSWFKTLKTISNNLEPAFAQGLDWKMSFNMMEEELYWMRPEA